MYFGDKASQCKLTEYAYDGAGNLSSENAGGSIISYTYDLAGNELTMTDGTGTTTRTYDELGRVLTKAVPGVGTVTYTYDLTQGIEEGCSQVTSTDPKGNITDKIYDKTGRLVKVITGEDEISYSYNDNGSTKSVTYSDGSKEEYTYYDNGSLKSLVNKKADGSIMDSYTYTYDPAGNQLSKTEIINGIEKGTTSYTYDTLNRLSTVIEPGGRTTEYTYDASGNRLTEKTIYNGVTTLEQYTYDSRNRLTEIDTKADNILIQITTYTYDKNGNQLTTKVDAYANGAVTSSATTAVCIYDFRDQLIKSVTAEGTVDNIYNGEGYRVAKTVDGEKTSFLYEGDKVVLEVDAFGNQAARNVYGINLLMRDVGGKSYSYMYNGHADVTALIDHSGTVAASYYYNAFGNILESSGDVDNNIRYAGYQYDEETGLYYLNARMYDPMTARFLQEDTYTGDKNDPLSLNLYAYGLNNPIMYTDPSGHKVKWYQWGTMLGSFVKEGIKINIDNAPWNPIASWNRLNGLIDTIGKFATGKLGVIDYCQGKGENLRWVTDNWNIITDNKSYKKGEIKEFGRRLARAYEELVNMVGTVVGLAEFSNSISDVGVVDNSLNDTIGTTENNLVNGTVNNEGASKTVDDFLSSNVPKQFQTQVKNAFGSDAKVTTLTQDTTVYRYYGGDSAPSSYWVTPNKVSNPISELALPPGNTAQYVDTIVLKKGTTVLEGTVAPNFGQAGGGYQYYVPGMK